MIQFHLRQLLQGKDTFVNTVSEYVQQMTLYSEQLNRQIKKSAAQAMKTTERAVNKLVEKNLYVVYPWGLC